MIYTKCIYHLIHTDYMQQKTKHQTGWSSAITKICTQEKIGFNLDWDIVICGFPQSLQVNVGTVPQLSHNHFLPNPFAIHQLHISDATVFSCVRIIKNPTCLSSLVSLLAKKHNTCILLPKTPIYCAQMCIHFTDGHFEKYL